MIVKRIMLLTVILTNMYNHVQGGTFLECTEHPQCVIEGFTDGNCCPNAQGEYQSCCHQAECDVNPKCFFEGLQGFCCPDIYGNYKDCCNVEPTPAPVINAECSAHPECQDLTGLCCPTTANVMLGTSYFSFF